MASFPFSVSKRLRLAAETGLDLKSASFEEMDALWKQAKKNLAK